jgi:pre-mRNA-splicing factor SYF2/beta-D-xylosidase 4
VNYSAPNPVAGVACQNDGSPATAKGAITRHFYNAVISKRDLVETFVASYPAVVKAGVAGVMCSYNGINGTPSCADGPLLNGMLRGGIGFNGYVASDCGAIGQIGEPYHNFTRNTSGIDAMNANSSALALNGGCDSDCGSVMTASLPLALNTSLVDRAALELAVGRLLRVRFSLGLFDEWKPEQVAWHGIGMKVVDSIGHRALALRAARDGIVLLLNKEAALPIAPATGLKIMLIGPAVNATRNMLSGYHGAPPRLISPLSALQSGLAGATLTYFEGCAINGNDTGAGIKAAVAAVADADVVIMGLGLCGNNYAFDSDAVCGPIINEAETSDRPTLQLPGRQMELFEKVQAQLTQNKKKSKLVVFTINAGAVNLDMISARADAILWAGYGGEYGGQAIADVIIGKHNPSGVLPYSIFPDGYVESLPYGDEDMRVHTTDGKHSGRTYRFASVTPHYEYGTSNSYSTFTTSWAAGAPPSTIGLNRSLPLAIKLTNSVDSKHAGAKVVIGFVSFVSASGATIHAPPRKWLFDFSRSQELAIGSSATVELILTPDKLALTDEAGVRMLVPGEYNITVGDLETTIRVEGSEPLLYEDWWAK